MLRISVSVTMCSVPPVPVPPSSHKVLPSSPHWRKPSWLKAITSPSAALHLLAVVGKAEVRPDEIELAFAARHDVARRKRVHLLLDDEAGEERDHRHRGHDLRARVRRVGH